MKKTTTPILVFTVTSNLIVTYIIIYSGIDKFFRFWKETSLKYTLGIAVVSFIWYLMWRIRIKYKKEFAELSKSDYIEASNLDADKDLMFTMCPKCENDCHYTSKDSIETKILICWNCQHIFSFAWCEKCGMGSDFIRNIPQNPPSWECPDCHSNYPTPSNIFDLPTKTISDKTLPANVKLCQLARQMKFEKEQALTGVWFLSSLLISFTLVFPILNSVTQAITKQNSIYVNDSISELLIPCGGFLVFLIVLVSTWYGLMFYPIAITKRFTQNRMN